MDHLFYCGPVGAMRPLPDQLADVDVPLERVGGVHLSAQGGRTVDTFGFKRSWTWAWKSLLPGQTAYVEALGYGTVPGPLRLIDPRRANRLPEQVASGGTVRRSSDGFGTVDDASLTYRPLTAVPGDVSTLGPGGLLSGCQEWVTAAGGGEMWPTDARTSDGTWRLPILPGEQLVASKWVTASADTTVTVGRREYTRGDVAAGKVGKPLPVRAGRWRQVQGVFTPARASVALTPVLGSQPETGASGVKVWTTGWQIAAVDAEALPGSLRVCDTVEQAAGWRPGGGCPEVVAEVSGRGYGLPWFNDLAFTLYEV